MTDKFLNQSITVTFEYPVVFTRDVFSAGNRILADTIMRGANGEPARVLVFVDEGVAASHAGLAGHIERYFRTCADEVELVDEARVVPGGERIKNEMDFVRDAIGFFMEGGLCRQSYVLAIGGGAVLDAVGFAAALFHRGLRLVRLPTTVLAQNDVGVGVKNAMNFAGGKNTVGTFNPPYAVINDFSFLPTLSDEHWINGVAEAFKVAIIRDAAFFEFLRGHAARFRAREQEPMEKLIVRCAELHLDHIRTSGDPFEYGRARPLDFGHWSAHRLETMSEYRISHGQAVATGIALDSCYARRQGWLADAELKAICEGLRACGFKLWRPELEKAGANGRLDVLQGLEDFRLHLGGRLHVTFPNGIGHKIEVSDVDTRCMAECVAELRRLDGGA